MIVFDESEYYNTALEEDTMRILLSFLPRNTYDKLLYGGEKYVRLDHPSKRGIFTLRPKPYRCRHGAIRAAQNEVCKEADTPLYTMAYRR